MAYFRRLAKAFWGVLVLSMAGGGQITIIASKNDDKKYKLPPANLNISPPLRPIPFTNNSMYLLMAKAMTSAPSYPILETVSVSLVNPLISANMTTLLMDCFSGRIACVRVFYFFSRRYYTTRAGRNPRIEKEA